MTIAPSAVQGNGITLTSSVALFAAGHVGTMFRLYGCEVEITGLTSPVYDSERFGIHFVASPRHADLLLVTGPVTRNMEIPLRKTYEATPHPKLVVAVGDCARTCGVFRGSYAIVGSVDAVIPVDAFVAGCPPEPADILRGILTVLDRLPTR